MFPGAFDSCNAVFNHRVNTESTHARERRRLRRAGMGVGRVRERSRRCREMPEAAGVLADARRVPGSPWVLLGRKLGGRLRSVNAPRLFVRARAGLEKANGADTVHWDGELTGFGVRVRKSGRKYYVVQTRVASKLRWFTVGPHGPLSPDQARGRALEILADAKKGIDPRDAEARNTAEPTVADLGRRFLDEYVPTHCKPSTQAEYRRSVKLFVDPNCRCGRFNARTSPRCITASATSPIRPTGPLGALEDVLPRRGLGLAPGRLQPLPARQALQGASARALPVARRDGSVGRSAARGGGRDALGRRRFPPTAAHRLSDVGGPRPALGVCERTASSFPTPRPADASCRSDRKPAPCWLHFLATRTTPG